MADSEIVYELTIGNPHAPGTPKTVLEVKSDPTAQYKFMGWEEPRAGTVVQDSDKGLWLRNAADPSMWVPYSPDGGESKTWKALLKEYGPVHVLANLSDLFPLWNIDD